jgi:hypothetical protein
VQFAGFVIFDASMARKPSPERGILLAARVIGGYKQSCSILKMDTGDWDTPAACLVRLGVL